MVSDGDVLMTYDGGAAESNVVADSQRRLFADDKIAVLLSSDHVVVSAVLQFETVTRRKMALETHLQFGHAIAATGFSETDAVCPK